MGTTGLIPGSQYCHVDHPYQRISLHRPLGLSSVDEPWPPVSATLGCTFLQSAGDFVVRTGGGLGDSRKPQRDLF